MEAIASRLEAIAFGRSLLGTFTHARLLDPQMKLLGSRVVGSFTWNDCLLVGKQSQSQKPLH